jgi:hypothetical protein
LVRFATATAILQRMISNVKRTIRDVKPENPFWKDLISGGHCTRLHSLLLTFLELLKRVATRAATTTRERTVLIKRGGDSKRLILYGDYACYQKDAGLNALGKHTFEAMIQPLTTRGEAVKLTKVPLGVGTEETSDDIEEAELEEARDLMEAEDLDGDDPAEFLAEQDAEKDGSE